jgi:WD40 repeat protein
MIFNTALELLERSSLRRRARVWDVGSGKEIQRFEEHKEVVDRAAFLYGDRLAVTSGNDQALRIWRVRK